ncbi:MAG: hypothetical protein KDK02_09300 [Rhodobacteraceae bacterium]|nr:hypothetical protein [Paracoccaceae bacterium]
MTWRASHQQSKLGAAIRDLRGIARAVEISRRFDRRDPHKIFLAARLAENAMNDRRRLMKQLRRVDPDNQVLREIEGKLK